MNSPKNLISISRPGLNDLSVLFSPPSSPFLLSFKARQFILHFYKPLSPSDLSIASDRASLLDLPLLSILESRLDVVVFRLG